MCSGAFDVMTVVVNISVDACCVCVVECAVCGWLVLLWVVLDV